MMKSNLTPSASLHVAGSSTHLNTEKAGKPDESRLGKHPEMGSSRLPLDAIGGSTVRGALRKMTSMMRLTQIQEQDENPEVMEKVGKLNLLTAQWFKQPIASEQDLPPIPADIEELYLQPKKDAWVNVQIDRMAIRREFVRLKAINNELQHPKDDADLWADAININGGVTFSRVESESYRTQFNFYKKMHKENNDSDIVATLKALRGATRNFLMGTLQKVENGEEPSRSNFADNVYSAVRSIVPSGFKKELDASSEARKAKALEKKRQKEWAGPQKGGALERDPDIGSLHFHHDDKGSDTSSILESFPSMPPRELSPSRPAQAEGMHPAARVSEEELGCDVYGSMPKDEQENLDAILTMMDEKGKLVNFERVPAEKRKSFVNYMAGMGRLRAVRMSLQIEEVPREEAS